MLVRFDQIPSITVNTNYGIMRAAAMLCKADGIADRIWPGVPQPIEWEHITAWRLFVSLTNYQSSIPCDPSWPHMFLSWFLTDRSRAFSPRI